MPDIRRVADAAGGWIHIHKVIQEMYRDLYNSLLTAQGGSKADTYFILKDFRSYADSTEEG